MGRHLSYEIPREANPIGTLTNPWAAGENPAPINTKSVAAGLSTLLSRIDTTVAKNKLFSEHTPVTITLRDKSLVQTELNYSTGRTPKHILTIRLALTDHEGDLARRTWECVDQGSYIEVKSNTVTVTRDNGRPVGHGFATAVTAPTNEILEHIARQYPDLWKGKPLVAIITDEAVSGAVRVNRDGWTSTQAVALGYERVEGNIFKKFYPTPAISGTANTGDGMS